MPLMILVEFVGVVDLRKKLSVSGIIKEGGNGDDDDEIGYGGCYWVCCSFFCFLIMTMVCPLTGTDSPVLELRGGVSSQVNDVRIRPPNGY
jgi:hypothetical protein